MKKFVYSLALGCLILACTKENTYDQDFVTSLEERGKPGGTTGIQVCHKDRKGNYSVLTVTASKLESHLAHGDYLYDEDKDGFSAPGACAGTMNDCNDKNAAINPGNGTCSGSGAVCPCFQKTDLSGAMAYHDSDSTNCFLAYSESISLYFTTSAPANQATVKIQNGIKTVTFFTSSVFCERSSISNLNDDQYNACKNLIKEVTAEKLIINPAFPMFCPL